MRTLIALVIVLASAITAAHPGGGIVALDDNSVVVGDPTGNGVWLFKKGRDPVMILKHFHCHWITRGLDGKVYVEAMQESGGAYQSAVFELSDLSKLTQVAHRDDLKSLVFVVNKAGGLVFPREGHIVQRDRATVIQPFGLPVNPLNEVVSLAWGTQGVLFIGDRNVVRRQEPGSASKAVATIDGKPLSPLFYKSPSPLIWGLAVDDKNRAFAAVPELGVVVRVDPDGAQHIVQKSAGGWRVTGVATRGTDLFLLESNDSNYDGPRVRVIRGSGGTELIGLAKAPVTLKLG
jgi:hypothetical protein